jgi:nicotinamide mononucleotide (NMN) deamidase PncC
MDDAAGREASAMFDAPQPLDVLAAETWALLTQAGVQLALAEAGSAELARLLSLAGGSPVVLTRARAFGTPEELALALRVSAAKVEAFGPVSAMVAAEAAAELIDTYEGGWGLVVIAQGNLCAGSDVQNPGGRAPAAFVALGTPSTTIIQECPPDQVTRSTLELLRQQALRRLQHSR